MIVSDRQTQPTTMTAIQQASSNKRQSGWLKVCLCLFLACLGASWFAYQYFLVPQPARFAPHWQDAQWIRATDGNATVTYFRYVTDLNTTPDAAFVTVAADQVFRLYVNGVFIGSNAGDFVQGNAPQAYIYDVLSALQPGPNALALRVANLDAQTPLLRASFGIVQGTSISYHGSGPDWLATAQSGLVYPHYATDSPTWITNKFDASSWLPVQVAADPFPSLPPQLTVNPLLYERPLAPQWMSAGSSHDAYFVRAISLSTGVTNAWLRIAATGPADVFINGKLYIAWNGEAPAPPQHIADYLSDQEKVVQYQKGLVLGIYNIAPYLHAGINTLAVHVSVAGSSEAQTSLSTQGAAITLDVLAIDGDGHAAWFPANVDWHASPQAIANWEQGSSAAFAWSFTYPVDRPGATQALYVPDHPTPRNVTILPLSLLARVILLSLAAVLGLWLLVSLIIARRYKRPFAGALTMLSVAYLPALACELLLVVLSHEPQISQPFPYTSLWGSILLALVGIGYLALWMHMRVGEASPPNGLREAKPLRGFRIVRKSLPAWLRLHGGLIIIILIAIPLICYNLAYEPYWQDELTSYYAAKGILAHGLPMLPSGFLYFKGELYSYVLALNIAIFGEQNAALRIPSVVEYLISLPLFYYVACYFFDRRVALLATAMLAFSPAALQWGRGVRMYEQAQLLAVIVMYLFYRALREPRRPRFVYMAVASLVIMYLSHEETFIVLPALVLCVFMVSWQGTLHARLPWVLYQKHWWFAALLGGSVIALQLLLVRTTHPPVLGTDQSQLPLVQLTTENFPYYLKLFFFPGALNATLPWITLNSAFALVGCLWALRRGGMRARYCALFLLISMLTLVVLFTPTSDRYTYPLLPAFYLVGAYGLFKVLQAACHPGSRGTQRSFACGLQSTTPRLGYASLVASERKLRVTGSTLSWPLRIIMAWTTILVCASVLILPILPISGYNLFVSRQAGLSYHRHYPDYDAVGQYMREHWQEGDVVIAVSPAISVLYYVGHVDYFFSLDRALYLFERDGRVIDTPTGSIPLLNQDDFQAVLDTHVRVWIVSDNGLYQSSLIKGGRFTFPPDFHIVYEGYGSAIYLRGG